MGPVMYLSLFGAVVLALFILWFVRQRYMGVAMIGIAFLVAGFGTALIIPGGKALTLGQINGASVEVVIANTYDEFTSYLKASALVFALVGVGLIAFGIGRWAAQDADRFTDVTPPVV